MSTKYWIFWKEIENGWKDNIIPCFAPSNMVELEPLQKLSLLLDALVKSCNCISAVKKHNMNRFNHMPSRFSILNMLTIR